MSLVNQARDLIERPNELLDFAQSVPVQFGLILPDLGQRGSFFHFLVWF